MIVDYNLNLAKLVLAGKVRGKFLLKTPSGEAPFRILELNRKCSGCLKGIGLWLKRGEFATEEEVLAFCPESGESANWRILIDLTDFEVGGYVSKTTKNGNTLICICSGYNDDSIVVSCWCNLYTGVCDNTSVFSLHITEVRPSTQEEIDSFLKIIKAKGKEVRDGKLVDICKEFTPFEKVLVRSVGEGWQADFFSKMKKGKYCTVSGRWVEDSKDIVPYNEETKHLLES